MLRLPGTVHVMTDDTRPHTAASATEGVRTERGTQVTAERTSNALRGMRPRERRGPVAHRAALEAQRTRRRAPATGPLVGSNTWYCAHGRGFGPDAVRRGARTVVEYADGHPRSPLPRDRWPHAVAVGIYQRFSTWSLIRRS